MKPVYIYRLIDPLTDETRYIGATTRLFARYREHVNTRHGLPRKKHAWIRSLKEQNLKPFLHVLEVVESDGYTHLEIEDRWMEHFQSNGAPLLNNALRGSVRGKYSQFIGVSRMGNGWQVHLRANDKYHNVGYFADEIEAARAYDAAARELRGTSARQNFPAA